MGVITVSRQMASHGCEIAAEAARGLGFRFIDREIIHRAAEEAGVPRIALQQIAYEGQRNVVDRILQAVNTMPPIPRTAEAWRREAATSAAQPFGGLFSPAVPSFAVTLKDYVHVMGMVIWIWLRMVTSFWWGEAVRLCYGTPLKLCMFKSWLPSNSVWQPWPSVRELRNDRHRPN